MKGNKKILIIVPYLGMSGTTSSLSSILHSKLAGSYDIRVFAVCQQNDTPLACNDIGLNSLTTAYYGVYSKFNAKDKLKYLWLKLLKRSRILSAMLEDWIIRRTVKIIEQRYSPDIIVGFQEGLATEFASHFSPIHKIAWIHCDYANAYGEDVNELDLYKRFENIVCVSDYSRKGFIKRYPSLEGRTVAIHNIFDRERVLEQSELPVDDPRFDTSAFTVISLGRIDDVKRFFLIPQIARELRKSGVDFRWYILGQCVIPQQMQRLEDSIHEYHMEENVIYLGGKSNPYPYLKASHLLVSLSKSEACPMVFNEAKILNVPILSADFGSAYEFIEEGRDGYICPVEMLPGKLIELTHNPSLSATVKHSPESNEVILEKLIHLFN